MARPRALLGALAALLHAVCGAAFVMPIKHRLEVAAPRPRIHVLTVAGAKNVNYTASVQEAVLATMSPADRYTTLCEPGCATAGAGRLRGVVEVSPEEAFTDGRCARKGYDCTGYELAQMRFVYGLVLEAKAALRDGALPDWYLLKDDDTLVDVEGLLSQVCGYGGAGDLASFAYPISCPGAAAGRFWIAGGRGWLLSGALAARLATEHGDEWLRLEADRIRSSDPYCLVDPRQQSGYTWDSQVVEVLGWVPGARLYDANDLGPPCTWHLGDGLSKLSAEAGRRFIAGCAAAPCDGAAKRRSAGLASCARAMGCTAA